MKILFAGKFDRAYNRTQVLLDGLHTIPGVEVSFYNYKEESFRIGKLKKAIKAADVVFLPSFTHANVALIKLLTRKPVIFDPLISRYLTKVFDYKQVSRYSIRAYKNYLKDRISMKMADLVVCDTESHRQYFHEAIGIPLEKMKVLEVGVNTDEFRPQPVQKTGDQFVAGFYGGFIPLQGATNIVKAAALLKEVQFHLIGTGFEFEKIKKLIADEQLDNVKLMGWVKYDELSAAINQFDICMGIFGDTHKADLVVPNKVYHYAAIRKAIISKDTPAIRHLFTDHKNILLTGTNAQDIAAAVLRLKNDTAFREKIAENGYQVITTNYNHRIIAQKLVDMAAELLASPRFAGA
ncbi:glycosyltransferase [Chitinophaga horti]|uniref:Glycosyltransferase n=1 Tax=Chitinophaga horti TaxID=2920382 RepID=A0ABY6J1W4_9BACT|nr:glycosyltransferase [Chitinophaga horti]UYQ93650.1 glycosyltransferase [Chitinophaga horti]